MVKKLLAVYLALWVGAPAVVVAEETETFPDYVVLPVEAGDTVPFEGVLLSLDAAAKILTEKIDC